jgi:OOP family OmpA-OmpF porin
MVSAAAHMYPISKKRMGEIRMRKKGFKSVGKFWGVAVPLVAVSMLSACTRQPVLPPSQSLSPVDLNSKLRSGQYRQKADNFLIIMDASSSMAQTYTGALYPDQNSLTQFPIEREFLTRMNQAIPDLKLNSALRSFGTGICSDWSETVLNASMAPYSRQGLDDLLNRLDCAFGSTPLDSALDAAAEDLKDTQGRNAIIVVSDGQTLTDGAEDSVSRLKDLYGDRVCVHTVWIDNKSGRGQEELERLADKSGCGVSTNVWATNTVPGMTAFVEDVFLEKGPAAQMQQPMAADQDSDGDGVLDSIDQCPDTPRGAKVNSVGCWVLNDVLFDIDKSVIRPEAYPVLDQVVEVFEKNPDIRVEVQGHTDSTASAKYNQGLSERRAAAIKAYLVSHGVASQRLKTRGFGLTKPVADNSTVEGRQLNRRVELRVFR